MIYAPGPLRVVIYGVNYSANIPRAEIQALSVEPRGRDPPPRYVLP